MPDLSLAFDAERGIFDLVLASPDLQGDDGLLTAVIISLFTDRRANNDDPLPDERVGVPSDMRGWWGDYFETEKSPDPIGSRLWLLWREKEMAVVVARAQEYASEALAWLTRDGRAARIEVNAVHAGPRMLAINIRALPLPGTEETTREWNFMYDYVNAAPVTMGTGFPPSRE